jgi:hypothetical protein
MKELWLVEATGFDYDTVQDAAVWADSKEQAIDLFRKLQDAGSGPYRARMYTLGSRSRVIHTHVHHG